MLKNCINCSKPFDISLKFCSFCGADNSLLEVGGGSEVSGADGVISSKLNAFNKAIYISREGSEDILRDKAMVDSSFRLYLISIITFGIYPYIYFYRAFRFMDLVNLKIERFPLLFRSLLYPFFISSYINELNTYRDELGFKDFINKVLYLPVFYFLFFSQFFFTYIYIDLFHLFFTPLPLMFLNEYIREMHSFRFFNLEIRSKIYSLEWFLLIIFFGLMVFLLF